MKAGQVIDRCDIGSDREIIVGMDDSRLLVFHFGKKGFTWFEFDDDYPSTMCSLRGLIGYLDESNLDGSPRKESEGQ